MKKNTIKALSIGVVGCLVALNLTTMAQITTLNSTVKDLQKDNKQISELFEKSTERIYKLEKEIKHLKESRWIYKGDYEATGYCNCPICCGRWSGGPTKSGKMPVQGRTIAVDPTVIPLGTEVVIDRHVYKAEDTGSAIKGHKIDVYFNSHEEAEKFGKSQKGVFI